MWVLEIKLRPYTSTNTFLTEPLSRPKNLVFYITLTIYFWQMGHILASSLSCKGFSSLSRTLLLLINPIIEAISHNIHWPCPYSRSEHDRTAKREPSSGHLSFHYDCYEWCLSFISEHIVESDDIFKTTSLTRDQVSNSYNQSFLPFSVLQILLKTNALKCSLYFIWDSPKLNTDYASKSWGDAFAGHILNNGC